MYPCLFWVLDPSFSIAHLLLPASASSFTFLFVTGRAGREKNGVCLWPFLHGMRERRLQLPAAFQRGKDTRCLWGFKCPAAYQLFYKPAYCILEFIRVDSLQVIVDGLPEARKHLAQFHLSCELLKVFKRFFPDLLSLLKQIRDPRDQRYVTYQSQVLLMMRILSSIFYICEGT